MFGFVDRARADQDGAAGSVDVAHAGTVVGFTTTMLETAARAGDAIAVAAARNFRSLRRRGIIVRKKGSQEPAGLLMETAFLPIFAALPKPTKLLLFLSDFMVNYWYIILFALAAGIWGFVMLLRTDRGRIWFDNAKLMIPLFKKMFRALYISRSLHTMGQLINAGGDAAYNPADDRAGRAQLGADRFPPRHDHQSSGGDSGIGIRRRTGGPFVSRDASYVRLCAILLFE